ncbi:PfkB family carbohydrate kinase [Haloarcula marina]|uniref:PfkB family carbohydrate kinase n=1 Tax=Haloarcula marina TaxID=2961574 RepID=UPI0020B64DDD|nr:PfkB family carbohydrate kinase [Halomicroarcula marina]
MARVVSLGSINVDRIRTVTDDEARVLESRYEWFPRRGETVEVPDVPPEIGAEPDRLLQGGKGANQAVAAAKGAAETTMLGKVGQDATNLGVLDNLRDSGVVTERIGAAAEPTGTAYVFVEPGGDNRIVVRAGANGAVDDSYVRAHEAAIRDADCLLLQNEVPPAPVEGLLSRLADAADRPAVVLDPSPVAGAERFLEYDAVDYLTPNDAEYEALSPHVDAYDGVVVHKRGPDDIVVEDGERFTVTPPPVDAVDTTGAGDVLNGFLAARLADGASLQRAVEVAAVAASLSTRTPGAQAGIPSLAEVLSVVDGEDGA